MQNTFANIQGVDFGSAALKQAIGEAAGRGADIRTSQTGYTDLKRSEAASNFSPPRETKRGPASIVSSE